MCDIEGLIVSKCDHIGVLDNFPDLPFVDISIDFIDSIMQLVAVSEHVFEPQFFELKIAVDEFLDSVLLDFIDFDVVSGLGFTLGLLLVSKIVGVKDTADTSDQMECMLFFFPFESLLD